MEQILHYEMVSDGICQRVAPPPSATAMTGLQWMVRNVLEWNQRIRQRQALAELDDHLLKDIGISRASAATEVSEPFWR
jgi:uncharacterized protein YjiS (DUF1127 family)